MPTLPVEIEQNLNAFVAAAKTAFQGDLRAVVLYGSAATEQMRATSDVNLLLLLGRFEQASADAIRAPLRIAHAAIELQVMFVLESELLAAVEAFAVKFADIIGRHRVLFGSDPFEQMRTARGAILSRLKQVLLNQQLRMRERYVLVSLREEQLVPLIADCAAPLRASAASLLQLEGQAGADGKEALDSIVQALGEAALVEALRQMSLARETAMLAAGEAVPTFMSLMRITEHLRERVARLQ
ncbi:putative nucleotidyltransferase [Oxalobacteraceae bacterium GrIS 1.11]